MATFVLIKEALISCLCLLKILIPLRGEEFHDGACNASGVLLLKLLDTSDTLMKILITNYARERDMITSSVHFFKI